MRRLRVFRRLQSDAPPICAQEDAPRYFNDSACDKFSWLDGRLAALERIEKRLLELKTYRNGAAIMAMELLDLMQNKEDTR